MTDWLPEIGDDDFATLLEALEAWEVKTDAGDMMADVFGTLLAGGDALVQARINEHRRVEKLKHAREAAIRKERSVILRAKLLSLRDRRRVERLAADAARVTSPTSEKSSENA